MSKIILLDLDGVLIDFISGCLKVLGRHEKHDDIKSWNFYREWGISDEEFWEKCSVPGFWYNLELYPWAKEFYSSLKKHGDVVISTSPSSHPLCTQEKIAFCQDKLGIKRRDIMVGGRKELMARPGRILIDDYIENINNFNKNIGTGLLFKQPWNDGIDRDQIIELVKNQQDFMRYRIIN
jgi:5'(3')-deoxyribonucleotidase